jgi:hypothetical protein
LSEKACEVEKFNIIRPTCKLQLQKGLQHWLTDAAVEGTFVWNSTRNVTTYTNWKSGQPGPNDIKTFYVRILQMFMTSKSVYPWQASPGAYRRVELLKRCLIFGISFNH